MITILNSLMQKVDILKKYTFAQYTDKFRDIGTFKIIVRLEQENSYLLNETEEYYILFNDNTFGKVESITKDSDSEYEKTITLTGRLSPVFLTKRIIKGTYNYEGGTTASYIYQLIYNNIVNVEEEDADRYINIHINYDNETYLNIICSNVNKQVTGGYIWDEIQPYMEQDKLGLFFEPIVTTKHLYEGDQVNISEWNLLISAGTDRTKGNKQGNIPVVFSQSLSNIARTSYSNSITNYKNVAYIAGEGEGESRKWYKKAINEDVNTKDKRGWNRSELWIDARDIQSKKADGTTLTDAEYEELITQRANEKASENTRIKSYESTITEANNQYTYGVDYKKGDFVTIVDDELGITVNAQITEVIKTIEGSREIVDIVFTYGNIRKDPTEEIKQTNKLTVQNQTDIKYLENVTNELGNKVGQSERILTRTVEKRWDDGTYIAIDFTKIGRIVMINFRSIVYFGSTSNRDIVSATNGEVFIPTEYLPLEDVRIAYDEVSSYNSDGVGQWLITKGGHISLFGQNISTLHERFATGIYISKE